jgi:hypothetical protein
MLLTVFVLKSYPYSVNQVWPKAIRSKFALAGLIAACLAGSVNATDYTFTGREGIGFPSGLGLNGVLTLDLNDPGTVTPLANGENGSSAMYASSNHSLSGSFGAWTFSGVPVVSVADGPAFWSGGAENSGQDNWIVRTPVTGPMVGGWTPVFLGFFYYTSPAAITSSQLAPHMDPLTNVNLGDFSFYFQLTDAADNLLDFSGEIFSVQSVPEPTAFSLFLLGGGLLLGKRFQSNAHRR